MRQTLHDILDNIHRIRRYTKGLDEEAFRGNGLVIDGVERCLSRISEAAVRLGDDADEVAPGPPWDQIRGLGNQLRHAYDIVSLEIIWGIVTDDLAVLQAACIQALAQLPPEEGDGQT